MSEEKPEAERSSGHTANREPGLESWKVKDNELRGQRSLTGQLLEAETSGQRQSHAKLVALLLLASKHILLSSISPKLGLGSGLLRGVCMRVCVCVSACMYGFIWAWATGRRHEWLSCDQAFPPPSGAVRDCSELSPPLLPPIAPPYGHGHWHCPLPQWPRAVPGGFRTEGCPDVPEASTPLSDSLSLSRKLKEKGL